MKIVKVTKEELEKTFPSTKEGSMYDYVDYLNRTFSEISKPLEGDTIFTEVGWFTFQDGRWRGKRYEKDKV